jgi:hypothetical protein
MAIGTSIYLDVYVSSKNKSELLPCRLRVPVKSTASINKAPRFPRAFCYFALQHVQIKFTRFRGEQLG